MSDHQSNEPAQEAIEKKADGPGIGDGVQGDLLSPFGSPEFVNAVSKLPPDVRQLVLMSSSRVGPHNPIADKLTPEHIGKIIDGFDKDSGRNHEDRQSSRRYSMAAFVIGLLFLAFVIWYLPAIDKELFKEVLKTLLALITGAAAGYGFGRYRRGDDD